MKPVAVCGSWLMMSSLVVFGCSGSTGEQAAIGAGVAIAATGIHRAATKDCWARCSPGYVCNERSGFCEPGECNPSCPAGYSCIVRPAGNECMATDNPTFNPMESTVTAPMGPDQPSTLSATADPPTPAAANVLPGRGPTGQVQIERGNPGPKGNPEPVSASVSGSQEPKQASPGPKQDPACAPSEEKSGKESEANSHASAPRCTEADGNQKESSPSK